MSALESYKKYGVNPRFVDNLMRTFFHYPDSYRDTLSTYKLLYWEPAHLTENIRDGMITREGIQYQVIYDRCNAHSIRECKQIVLSFRAAAAEFELTGVVIVRPVKIITDSDES